MTQDLNMGAFRLGEPALVCRWRLANRKLPLQSRHLKALSMRRVNGKRIDQNLVVWARQHIEWTLESGSSAYPNGVLMLIVDTDGQAAMTVGPFEPMRETSLSCLVDRSRQAHEEAERTGIAPETLWLVRDGVLLFDEESATTISGSASLVESLAHTLGMPVRRDPLLRVGVEQGSRDFEEAFLVSDEYGVVPSFDFGGPRGKRFADGYERLLANERKR